MQLSKGLVSGLVFIAIGLGFLFSAWSGYEMGTATRMGPAYFPMLCGGALALVGVLAILTGGGDGPVERVHLAPLLIVAASLALFALLAQRAGLVVAMSLSIFVATLARRDMTLLSRLLLAAGTTAAMVVIFAMLLRVSIPIWPRF